MATTTEAPPSESEKTMHITFIEKQLNGNEPARCVDGRPSTGSEQGPQMLGGSLHPMVLAAIFTGSDIDKDFLSTNLTKLQKAGFKTGAHRGSHAHGDASDCGAADRLKDILATAVEKRELITSRLLGLSPTIKDLFPDLEPFKQLLNNVS